MNVEIATRIIDFIFEEVGYFAIVCDGNGVIVAARDRTRIGITHAGAQRILRERLPSIKVTVEEAERSGGLMKAGVSLPIVFRGEWLGTLGVAGDLEYTVPIAKLATGMLAIELQEAETRAGLLEQAREMNAAIAAIAATIQKFTLAQGALDGTMQEVSALMASSIQEVDRTEQVIGAIQDVATQTNMLGLNAAIEAANAGTHGRGFKIVAEAVRSLSGESRRSVGLLRTAHDRLQEAMDKASDHARRSAGITREQSRDTEAIARMVDELRGIGDTLLRLAHRDSGGRAGPT